ncbi:hypothetical protein BDZ88DRAFT_433036 [Geranomyces variabilis]|nr:hypothetical protein BDZ88DRAFT_433036 [Geranomyces variabilis]KAJ3133909.1 hypothetical protein HDU90_005517 [Geranomyces variabilis]
MSSAQCYQLVVSTAQAAADSAALAYGGPGVLIGTTWPIVAASSVISTWRMKTKPCPRATLLFIATLLNLADTANGTFGKMTPPSVLTGNNKTVLAYIILLVLLSQLRIGTIFAAASFRFGAVYSNPLYRRILIVGMCLGAFGVTTLNCTVGIQQVLNGGHVLHSYWGMAIILPICYIILGITVFSLTLRKHQQQVSGQTGSVLVYQGANGEKDIIDYLQMSNNILMAFTIICAAIIIVLTQALDSRVNQYVIPASLFINSLFTLAENAFELLTIWQKAADSTPMESAASSDQGGRPSVGSKKGLRGPC